MIKAIVNWARSVLCEEATYVRKCENPFRSNVAYFGRNMSNKRFVRACRARVNGNLENHVKFGGAYNHFGDEDNNEFSIYFLDTQSENLFWQFYAIEKQREKFRNQKEALKLDV